MDNKELFNSISQINERTARSEERAIRTEEKVDAINKLIQKSDARIEDARDKAVEASNSSERAHDRIDKIEHLQTKITGAVIASVVAAVLSLVLG